jgi:hypothetical protein
MVTPGRHFLSLQGEHLRIIVQQRGGTYDAPRLCPITVTCPQSKRDPFTAFGSRNWAQPAVAGSCLASWGDPTAVAMTCMNRTRAHALTALTRTQAALLSTYSSRPWGSEALLTYSSSITVRPTIDSG